MTLGAPIEYCLWLISRPHLNRLEISLVIVTILNLALLLGCVYVFPGICTTEHIVYLLPYQVLLLFDLVLHFEHVGTRLAVEAELTGDSLLCQQYVRASRAEQHCLLVKRVGK